MSLSPPPQHPVKGNNDFFYGFYIQPESPEDPAQQVRVKGKAPSCCIGLLMPFYPPRGGQIEWGVWVTVLLLFFLLPWQRATHTHMSPQEVLQVKARFNGCFSDSLLESSLFKGITEVLTDCKSSDKEHRKKRTRLVRSCEWSSWIQLMGSIILCLYMSQLSCVNLPKSESRQKVSKGLFSSAPENWRCGDKRFSPNSDHTWVTISIRQEEAHVAVDKSDNTPLCPPSEMTEMVVLQIHQAELRRADGCDTSGGFTHRQTTVRWWDSSRPEAGGFYLRMKRQVLPQLFSEKWHKRRRLVQCFLQDFYRCRKAFGIYVLV